MLEKQPEMRAGPAEGPGRRSGRAVPILTRRDWDALDQIASSNGVRRTPASPEAVSEGLVERLGERLGQPVALLARFGILGADGPMVMVACSGGTDADMDALDALELDPSPALSNRSGRGWWGVSIDLGEHGGEGVLAVAGAAPSSVRRQLTEDAAKAGKVLGRVLARNAAAHQQSLEEARRQRSTRLAQLREPLTAEPLRAP